MIIPDNARLRNANLRDFRVRKEAVRTWLLYLIQRHPLYMNDEIQLSTANIESLPEDANVLNRITNRVQGGQARVDESLSDEDLLELMENLDHAAVPDMMIGQTEVEQVRRHAIGREARDAVAGRMQMPELASIPIDEFDPSILMVAGAFPTLFPDGEGDPN